MKPTHLLPALALLVPAALAASAAPAAQTKDDLPPADTAITGPALTHHVKLLASEGLANRGLGAPQTLRAARYLAAALERAKLQPAGDDDSFLKKLALLEVAYTQPPRLVLTTADGTEYAGECGVDFTLQVRGLARTTPDLPIRIVSAIKKFAPDPDPRSAIYIEGERDRRQAVLARSNLEDLGGFGLELEANIDRRHAKPGPRTETPRAWTGAPAALEDDEGCERVVLRGDLLEQFVTNPAVRTARLEVASERRELPVYDVVAVLPGAGTKERPELAEEAVVVHARYDHSGVATAERKNRSIRGVDEATGVAALLEVAESLTAGPRPARTVVFLLTAGQDHERLGEEGYLRDPAVPLERTVAWIHLDRLGRQDARLPEGKLLYVTGHERSDLLEQLAQLGLAVAPDPYPRAKLYARLGDLDTGAHGVVTHALSSFPFEEGGNVLLSPEAIDHDHLLAATRVAADVVRALAAAQVTPSWHPGMQPKGLKRLLRGG